MKKALICFSIFGMIICNLQATDPIFIEQDGAFSFNSPVLSGTLKEGGKGSPGLTRVIDRRTGEERAQNLGLFTLYRVFDRTTRYGDGRSRESVSKRLPGGGVEYLWPADANNPFKLRAVYRWADEQSLDLTLQVTAGKDLEDFELFLSSYVEGSDRSFVYARNGTDRFVEALESDGSWHLFPRDQAAQAMVLDGRWQRGANPVEWAMRPKLAGALGLRRTTRTGATTLVMSRPSDCFAVSTPFGNEPHHSLYLSLFGRNIKRGETDTAHARLVLGHQLTDPQAIAQYQAYIKGN